MSSTNVARKRNRVVEVQAMLFDLAESTATAGSDCGANGPGGGGFQPGNTCGGKDSEGDAIGGGSASTKKGRMEAFKQEILDAADKVGIEEVDVIPDTDPVDVDDYDEMENRLDRNERAELKDYMEEMRSEAAEAARDYALDDVSEDDIWDQAGWGEQDIIDKVDGEAADYFSGDSYDAINGWLMSKSTDGMRGDYGMDKMVRHIRDMDIEWTDDDDMDGFVNAVQNLRDTANGDYEKEQDKIRDAAVENFEWDSLEERIAKEEWLDKFRKDNPGRFDADIATDTWLVTPQKSFLRFKTSSGNAYDINAEKMTSGQLGIVVHDIGFYDSKGSFAVTGAGSAHEVFSHVMKSVTAYADFHNPTAMTFMAKEPSRRRLYDRVVKSLAAVMPEYSAMYTEDENWRYYAIVKRDKRDEAKEALKTHRKTEPTVLVEQWTEMEPRCDWKWRVSEAFCPTGEGGGVDNSCGSGDRSTTSGHTSQPKGFRSLDDAIKLAGLDSETRDQSKSDTKPAEPKIRTVVRNESEVNDWLQRMDIPKVDRQVLSQSAGALEGSTVVMMGGRGGVHMEVHDDRYRAVTSVQRSAEGDLYLENWNFQVFPHERGRGLGTEIIKTQIDAAHQMGARGIVVHSIGDWKRRETHNGYYTWPRMGFDGDLPRDWQSRMMATGLGEIPEQFSQASRVSDFFKKPEGRELWKRHGFPMELAFDVQPGSLSRKVFDNYYSAQTRRQAEIKQEEDDTEQARAERWRRMDAAMKEFDAKAGELAVTKPPENHNSFDLGVDDDESVYGAAWDAIGRTVEAFCPTGKDGGVKNDCEPENKGEGGGATSRDVVRSKEFKRWFGDWESESGETSKVVKKDGSPQETYDIPGSGSQVSRDGAPVVVYHGTARGGFSEFKKDKISQDTDSLLYGPGFYFTEDKEVAETYTNKDAAEVSHPKIHQVLMIEARLEATLPDGWKLQVHSPNSPDYPNQVRLVDPNGNDHKLFQRDGKTASVFGRDLYESLPQAFQWDEETTKSWHELLANNGVSYPLPEVKELYLNIRKPLDIDKTTHVGDMAGLRKVFGDRLGGVIANQYGYTLNGAHGSWTVDNAIVYKAAVDAFGNKEAANQALRELGFDGLTHIGGVVTDNKKHRVWIAFEPNQIKSIENRGGFRSDSANIYESSDNCGTGDGGFQPGNTCASSGGGSSKPTKKEKQALQDYSTDKFVEINGQLRSGKLSKEIAAMTGLIDSALEKMPKREGATVRSFTVGSDEEFAKISAMLKEGGVFTDASYMSTRKTPTLSDKVAFSTKTSGNRHVVMRVEGKSGVDISDISLNPGEGEVLYPRGARFKVNKVIATKGGGLLAVVSEIQRARG